MMCTNRAELTVNSCSGLGVWKAQILLSWRLKDPTRKSPNAAH
jgi:hypothetical protein